jgi:hypothetical protein
MHSPAVLCMDARRQVFELGDQGSAVAAKNPTNKRVRLRFLLGGMLWNTQRA